MKKRKERKNESKDLLDASPFGSYRNYFEPLKKGEARALKDKKSAKHSFLPIRVGEEGVFLAEPDGKLIPELPNQRKCDFLAYCQMKPQACFIELKGENISVKEADNPYDQIRKTLLFLRDNEELGGLASGKVEKHAFIVSPGRQKLPKGVEHRERQLWQALAQLETRRSRISDLVHYVKVTNSDPYSQGSQIICSPKSPMEIPFKIRKDRL